MGYSNGYNITSVLSALTGRLAWATSSGLNSANTTTKSGRRFDDGSFHSVVSVDNIKAVNANQSDYDAFFTSMQESVIIKALQSVFDMPEFQQQLPAYTPIDEIIRAQSNTGKAVGWMINIAAAFDITHQIKSLELYFDAAQTFNIYLFKAGDKTALKTKSVTTVPNKKTLVSLETDNWYLNSNEATKYYIIYFQADLMEDTNAFNENAIITNANYFKAIPFSAVTVLSDFDRSKINELSITQGLNFKIVSFKDFTQNILNQVHLFDELIGLQMAYNIIEQILYSTESDKKERILKGQLTEVGLQLDLKGQAAISEGPKTKGLQQRIEAEINRIKKAFYPSFKSTIVNDAGY